MENLYRRKPFFCKKCGSLNLETLGSNIANENHEENTEQVVLKCRDCGQTFTNSDIEKANRLHQADLKHIIKTIE